MTSTRINFPIKTLSVFVMSVGISATAQIQTYCTKIGDSISCTTYDHGSASQSYCTSIAGNLSCTTYGDNYDRVQVLKNYEAGQVIGTALGNAFMGAIAEYKAHKRIKQEEDERWNQILQNVMAASEINCEKEPNSSAESCRRETFVFNQFVHRHKKDFVVDMNNLRLMSQALESLPDASDVSEETYESAFRKIDKRKLDKKVYLDDGTGADRSEWTLGSCPCANSRNEVECRKIWDQECK